MRVIHQRYLLFSLVLIVSLASLLQTSKLLHSDYSHYSQQDNEVKTFLPPPLQLQQTFTETDHIHIHEKSTDSIKSLSPAPASTLTCNGNDTALYFDINSRSWGVYSNAKRPPSVDSALQTSHVLWMIANWISLPNGITTIVDSIKEKQSISTLNSNNNMTIKLLITDSRDMGTVYHIEGYPLNKCLRRASDLLGSDNVYLASRHLVEGRDLRCFVSRQQCNEKTNIGTVNGTVLAYRRFSVARYIHNGVVAKWDFALRNEYLPVFDNGVRQKLGLLSGRNGYGNNASSLISISSADYFSYPRAGDVGHLWDVANDGQSNFRDQVTKSLRAIKAIYNLTGAAGLVSPRERAGRVSTSDLYASALLDHKIILVAQRDRWEDHLRLFESLAAGAMVLSDPITHPPAGLINGTNIVYFTSLEDMLRLILYYLNDEKGREERVRIAWAGRSLILKHHKPHHRYERLMLREDNWPNNWANPVAPLLNCD